VVSIGHGVKEIPDAMYAQAQEFSFYPAHAFSNKHFRDLSESLAKLAPGDMKDNAKVWITCTGTDATDDAVRLARQYWVEKDVPSKYIVITHRDHALAGVPRQQHRRRRFFGHHAAALHLSADVRRFAAHPARLLLSLSL
jgi:4-aminobutyrate aminotransferase-like enzyme